MSYLISFLQRINWIDILIFALFIRLIFISLKNGLAAESFKIAGAVLAAYVSLHYYPLVSGSILSKFKFNVALIESVSFAALAGLGFSFFSLLRMLLKRFFNMEVVPAISRWGGLIIGVTRAFLISSLALYFFLVTNNGYLRKSVLHSFCGATVVYAAPSAYAFLWENIMSKLDTDGKMNRAAFEIEKERSGPAGGK